MAEKYIPIEEIPPARTIWPYQEWVATIPENMALEITDQLQDRSVAGTASTITQYFRLHDLPLTVMRRHERLFIARKAGGAP